MPMQCLGLSMASSFAATQNSMLPPIMQDLYIKICGVSYIGDVRMGFAEDSRKTDRIAQGSAEGLALMYNKRLQVRKQIGLHKMAYAMYAKSCTSSSCWE